MADDEQFSLCWNNFNSNLSAGFHESLCRGDLVDVTLAAEGQFVKAHRLVLSVCSPYFRKMFTQMPANQHAFVFLKDVSHTALKDLIQFMYCGEVNVKQEALPAFISTAEALQIKGLTDSDPPTSQSPAEPSTPQPQIQQISSPRVRQRTTTSRATYKIDTLDENGDKITQQPTQIVIQTTAPPQQTIQTLQQQHVAAPIVSTGGTTATVVTHKRPAQRSIGSTAPHIKRTKSTIDPLEVSEMGSSGAGTSSAASQQQQQQQITVQTTVVPSSAVAEAKAQAAAAAAAAAAASDTEYIDLPMEIPTKAEPDYADEAGEVDAADNDGAGYVEDDSYGEMRYDESYFTENDDGPTTATGAVVVSSGAAATSGVNTATTSKAVVKQQAASFSDSSYAEAADQSNNDAQGVVKFIRSQKKNAQLVYGDYLYNKKLTLANGQTTWRCVDVLKLRCKAVVVTKNNKFVVAKRQHNHENHLVRISSRALYDEEEDLNDYIKIISDNSKIGDIITIPNIEITPMKNGKEYKLFVSDPAAARELQKISQESM